MGGDAILHHPGNSARFDYISQVFKASRHSKSRRLYLNIMQLAPGINVEEVFQNETILALSRYKRGHRLNPVSALYQAEDIFNYCEDTFNSCCTSTGQSSFPTRLVPGRRPRVL